MSLGSVQAESVFENATSRGAGRPQVLEIDPCDDPRWERLVQGSPHASLFHSTRWLEVLRRSYGFAVRATVLVEPDGELSGGAPHVLLSDARGLRIASLPFSDFCDPLTADEASWAALAQALVHKRVPASFRCLHNETALGGESFAPVKQAMWHGVDLTRSVDEMWESVHANGRRAIRKARNQGVELFRAETKADLREFYELHRGIRTRKYRMLAQPYCFFENIWDEFLARGAGFLLLARHEGAVIAGGMYLQYGDTIYYKFNASSRDQLQVRPNDLIIWEGMRLAKEELNCRKFDFGLSDADQEGLLRYKRKFATEEKTIQFMHHRPAAWAARSAEQDISQLLPQLTEILTDDSVPEHVAERAGNLLYRLFA